jgi:hypothetical protein
MMQYLFCRKEVLSFVMRGLDPRIPLRGHLCQPDRDGRDEPGHDEQLGE